MLLKKNIKVGKLNQIFIILNFIIFFKLVPIFSLANELEGKSTDIKVLDKISSKNTLIKLENGKEIKHKDLLIKSIRCSNSEFDDNPEITAYIQVKDITNKNKDNVFVFNDWIFSSSPSIKPFDHPVYDIWLIGCY